MPSINMLIASISFNELGLLLLAGIVSGILSSAPVGPANLWLLSAILPPSKRFANLSAYVFGIIVVDIFYAFIAFWGYSVYLQGTESGRWLGIFGGLGVVVLGLLEFNSLFKQSDTVEDKVCDKRGSVFKDFLMGAFICGSNPVFVMFWLMVAKYIDEYGVSDLDNVNSIYVFAGIAVGDLIWYAFFAHMVKLGMSLLSVKFIFYLRLLIATSLILLGAIAFIKYI